jgi:RAB protein geranylgeranyltransferase component A
LGPFLFVCVCVNDTMAAAAEDATKYGADGSALKNVNIAGNEYEALADGEYDVILLGTGMKECVLAGLLSVKGMKVLQVDRNDYYGGNCASLDLESLCTHFGQPYDDSAKALGRPRRYLIDLIPKFILANGKLVKMLLHTGVTRYIDFQGVASSYVYTDGSIYKVPVTPSEALKTSLVGFFQKRYLRSFAQFLGSYESQKVAETPTDVALKKSSPEQIRGILKAYYDRHNPNKSGEVDKIMEMYADKLAVMFATLEKRYGIPAVPEEVPVEFGEGSLGLMIKAVPTGENGDRTTTQIVKFNDLDPELPNAKIQRDNVVNVGDIISTLNGEDVLWMPYADLLGKIKASKRPLQLTFMKPLKERPPAQSGKYDLNSMTMADLYKEFGLDENSQCFIGHAMALHTDDSYLSRTALETMEAVKVYGTSVGRYGQNSPYLYPQYGLSNLPEGFARLAAVYGSTIMLRKDVEEILKDKDGKVCGVRAGKQAAKAPIVIGDPSYFPKEDLKVTGKIIRTVCVMSGPVPKTDSAGSAQIILPSMHLKGKKNDIFISILSKDMEVCPEGFWLGIVSTEIETANPQAEIDVAIKLLGNVVRRFDGIAETYAPIDERGTNGQYITKSYDATSHFSYESTEIEELYERITGEPVNFNVSVEEMMAKQRGAMGM